MKVTITKNADSRHFTGVVFNRIPVRSQNTWVVGFRTDYKHKEQLKGFCTARGGGWEPVEKIWFVPVPGATPRELLPEMWAVVEEAVNHHICGCLPEVIEITLEANLGKHSAMLDWLETKARNFRVTSSLAQDIERAESEYWSFFI